MHTDFRLNELNAAIAAEYEVTALALQRGLEVTKPLTVVRLAELCALGEKMMQAKVRKETAYLAAYAWIRRERLDIVLPDANGPLFHVPIRPPG